MIKDIKLYMINTLSLSVTTFSTLETTLKIILLCVTIGYTITKWISINDDKDNK